MYVYQQIGNIKKKGKKGEREREGNWPFLTENLRSTVLGEAGLLALGLADPEDLCSQLHPPKKGGWGKEDQQRRLRGEGARKD